MACGDPADEGGGDAPADNDVADQDGAGSTGDGTATADTGTPTDGTSGADTSAAADSVADDDTATGASSGSSSSSSGSDATTADTASSSGADTKTADSSASSGGDASAGMCGNGKCDVPTETIITCPADCAGGANCGDGKCEGIQENGFSCAADCKVDASSIVTCIMKGCSGDVVKCLTDTSCAQALGCVQGCKSDILCMAQCGANLTPAAQQTLTGIVQCGGQKGCFGVGGSGAVCGDSKCEGPSENALNCAKDCAPVCGDGKCEFPQENQWFCAKDCKPAKCGDGKCEQLENQWTCAKDCVPATCGNGTCDKPDETSINCFKDCQPGSPQATCVATKCGTEMAACGGDVQCGQAMLCTGNCSDATCFAKCADNLAGGSKTLFDGLSGCATKNACLK